MFIIDDIISAIGAHNASLAQERAAQDAMGVQRDILGRQQGVYDQSRADQQPWMDAGRSTLADLLSQMRGGGFDQQYNMQADPGFQFRMAEGQKALERSAAARGGLNSGGFMKGLAGYSQGLASDEYQRGWERNRASTMDRFGRMMGLVGMGQQSAQYLGGLGAQHSGQMGRYADSMSGLYGALGNARSAGAMGVANGIGGAVKAGGNLAMLAAGVPPVGMMGGGGGGGGVPMIPTQYGMVPTQGYQLGGGGGGGPLGSLYRYGGG